MIPPATRHIYMLVVGSDFTAGAGQTVLHAFIETNPNIQDWWHHLDSCYILVTTTPMSAFQEEVCKRFPSKRFFLADVNPKHYAGWLPQDAWTWLEKFKTWQLTFRG